MKKILSIIFFWGVFSLNTLFAFCPLINSSFTPSAVDICGAGATTISFINSSTGANASTATYDWYVNGVFFDNTTGLGTPNNDNISTVGTYTYMVVANDSGGTCTDSFSVNVVIHPLPVPSFIFTPNNACAGTIISFTNTSAGNDASTIYSWNFGDGGTSSSTNPSHSYAAGGTYNVVLTMTNTAGCLATFNTSVIVKSVPIISILGDDGDGDLFHCLLPTDTTAQETVTFFNSTTGAISYSWDYGDGSPIFTTSSNAAHTHTYTSYGTYTVTFTALGANGCSVTQTLTVVFEKFVAASFSVPVTETSGCLPHVVNAVNGSVNANTYIWDFGDGSPLVTTTSYIPPPHSYLTGGMFTISVTAANSCNTSIATVGPIIISGPPIVDFGHTLGNTVSTTPGCAPQVMTFNNVSTGAVPANNYIWDMGNGNVYTNTINPSIQTYNSGQYTVALVASNACGSDTITSIFIVDTVPHVFMDVNPIEGCTPLTVNAFDSAYGGSLTTQWYIDGGVWTYTGWPCYCWQYLPNYTNIDTIPTQIFTAPPGNAIANHTIRLVVSNHCGTFDSIVNVVVHPTVQSIFAPLASTICEGSAVTFSQSSYGDSLTFAWDFGNGSTANTPGPHTITYAIAGTYTVQLITTGYCGSDTLIGTVIVNPFPIANILADTLNGCEDLTVNFTNNSSPGATSYSWVFNGGIPITSAVFNPGFVLFPNPGINMVTLAVDSLGCINRDTVYIDVFALPLPSFTVTPNVGCTPLDVAINNTSPVVVGDIYTWDLGNGNTSTSQNPPNQTYTTVIIDSIYNIQLTIQTVNGCIDSVAQTVTVHPIPVASILPSSDTVCVNENIIFSNNSIGATTYAWDFGDGNTSVAINPTHAYIAAGTYVVQLISTSAFACSDTITTTILVDSLPTSNFGYTIECFGNPTIFTDSSSNAISWSWAFGDGNTSTQQNPSNLYALAGIYSVSLTTTNLAGCTHTLTLPVVVKSVAVAAFANPSTCLGTITSFTDASSGTPISWSWAFGDGNTSAQQNPSNLYVSIGNYTVQLIVAAGSGCFDTIAQIITVDSVPTANFTFTNVCANDSTFFTSISTGNPNTYNWNFGNGNTDNTNNTNPSNIYLIDGSYTVSLIVGYAVTGCTDTLSQVVTAFPRTVPNFSNNTACLNDTTFFSDLTTNTPITWAWDFGDGNTSAIQHVNHIYLLDGTYSVTLVTSNSFGCTDSITQSITVNPLPTALFSFDTVCLNVSTTFIDNSINTATWTWDFGDGFTSASQNPTHLYTVAGAYTVQLIAANTFGCTDTVVNNIIVNPLPSSNFGYSIECVGNPTIFTDSSLSAVSWGWDFGDGNTSTQQNPSHQYALAGTYNVILTTTNNVGCTNTIIISVIVNEVAVAAFANTPTCLGAAANFTDNSSGIPISWGWDFGDGNTSSQQNPSNIYAVAGTYNVELIVAAGSGCFDTISQVITVDSVPTANFSFTNVCSNDTTFFVSTSIGNPDVYSWTFGDGNTNNLNNPTPNNIYLIDGSYTVQLIAGYAASGCADTISQTVISYPHTIPNLSNNTACLNDTTFFADLTTNSPTLWNWDFGDGNTSSQQNATTIYLLDGTYNVTLTTINTFGCADSITQTITVNPLPTAIFTFDTICLNTATTFIDNSINAVSWTWDFGDATTSASQSPTHLYSIDGTYNVQLIVTNTFGCADTIVNSIIVHPNPFAVFAADTMCFGVPTTFIDNSTGTPISWNWTFGDGNTATTQNTNNTYPIDSTYTAQLIIANVFGCGDTISNSVVVLPQPTAGFAVTLACAKQQSLFADTSLGTPSNWQWNFGNGNTSTQQNPSNIYLLGGTYNVQLIIGNGAGCSDTTTNAITVSTVPIPGFFADTVCFGNVTTFTNTVVDTVGIAAYDWDFGDGNTSNSANPTYIYQASGTYTVTLTATNINGCDSTISYPVIVNSIPIANYTVDTVCLGSVSTFADASSGVPNGWIWDFGDGSNSTTGPITTHTYLTPGSFLSSLIVSGGSANCTDQVFQIVEVIDDVIAGISVVTPICDRDVISFIDNSTINLGTIVGWTWNFGDGNTSSQQNPTHTYVNPGTYTVTLSVLSNGGCTSSTSVIITVNINPTAIFTPQDVCLNIPSVFTDLSTGNPTNWQWNFGDGNTSTQQNSTNTYANSGQYNVTLTVITDFGCTDVLTEIIRIYDLPTAAFTNNLVCVNDTMIFTDQSTISNGTIISWNWDFGDGNTSAQQNPKHPYVINSQTFNVQLIVTSNLGCTDVIIQTVNVLPVPNFDFIPILSSGCEGDVIQFNDNSLISGATITNWQWNFGDGYNSFLPNPTHIYNTAGNYFVGLTLTTSDNCFLSDTLAFPVNIYPNPIADFIPSPNQTSMYAPTITFIDNSTGATAYDWNFGDGFGTSTVSNPVYTYQDTGFYTTTQIVISNYGCRDTIQKTVRIKGEFTLFVPNAFTPDGDANNNTFLPKGMGIVKFRMLIFDRWGEKLFESNDLNVGWDGTYKGEDVPLGVYVYRIFTEDVLEEEHKYVGRVTVIR